MTASAPQAPSPNPKGDLIARLISLGAGSPTFQVTADGPPHERTFQVRVLVGGRELGAGGEGRSKKDAERLAAESALRILDQQDAAAQEAGTVSEAASAPDTIHPQGVWPIYSAVLEGALETALELADEDATIDDVRRDAARLYRDLLSELGHGPEQPE